METSTISALVILAILIGVGVYIAKRKRSYSGDRKRGGSDSTKNQQR